LTTSVALDPITGDIALSGGRASVQEAASPQRIAQKIQTATKLFFGEDRFDSSVGFPWQEEIFLGKIPPKALEARLRTYWLALDGVESVDSVTIDLNKSTRLATIYATFNEGTVEVTI
jgi:hypothetical protein